MTDRALPWDADRGARARIHAYVEELLRWNRGTNLCSWTAPAEVAEAGVNPTLAVLSGAPPARALDLGSGSGIPALVLAAVHPATHWTLVERKGRKALFLRHALPLVGATGQVLETDWEAALQDRGGFDLVTARALHTSAALFRWAAGGGLAPGGRLWLWTAGERLAQALEEAAPSLPPPQRRITGPGPLEWLGFERT